MRCRTLGNRRWWVTYALSLGLIAGGHLVYSGYFAGLPTPAHSPTPVTSPVAGGWLEELRQGRSPQSVSELDQAGLTWLCGYSGGHTVVFRSQRQRPRGDSLRTWFAELDWRNLEAVEVGLGTEYAEVKSDDGVVDLGNWGMLFACPQGPLVLSPCELARRPVGHFATYQKLDHQRGVLQVRKFAGPSWTMLRDRHFSASPLLRGESEVPLDSVDIARIRLSTLAAGRFQQRLAQEGEGLLPHLYNVVDGKSSEQDRVLLRLCLGSWSLASFNRWTGSVEDRELGQRNLEAMVERFGHWRNDRFWMADGAVCQLGSQALFGLALRVFSNDEAWLRRCEQALGKALLEFQEPDGHFRSSQALSGAPALKLVDPEDDVAQDYFPGEALCYLAERGSGEPEGPWLAAYNRGLEYYRARFERRPHPGAVPWLAWACVRRYRLDGHVPSRELAFRVLDWQLENLQPFEKMDPFLRGGPTNPDRKHYAAFASASGTGAQLEGLVAGHWLARKVGDATRQRRYMQAILEHSRYLVQLQYRDEAFLYWLDPELRRDALGGIRDLPWSQQVQVDSCAHAVNAWVELLEQEGLKP